MPTHMAICKILDIKGPPVRRPLEPAFIRSRKIAGTALGPLALFAFGEILDLAVFEKGLHLDLSAAGAIEALRRAGRTGVLGYLCHSLLLLKPN